MEKAKEITNHIYQLTFTNTLTNKKEKLIPIEPANISLYVCGITPYDYSHIGHARCYITFDVLYRLLKVLGYQVKYCRNYTDIDDKLLKRAQEELGSKYKYSTIADKFIKAFQEDMAKLNCLVPDCEPRVTDHIDDIIVFIEDLIKNNYAYVVNGSVYFSIESFEKYGKLSKRSPKELQAGARIGILPEKRNPLDFALWKREEDNTFWYSPWGWGRPGWHIECSVMATKHLGKTIDIHCGGMDLIFPHHENEIAQSEAQTGQEFANYWIHNAFVRINKEKMSKSLGNFLTLRDVFKEFDPIVLRYYILTHNYRIPLDFSDEDLLVAQKSYKKLVAFFDDCPQKPFILKAYQYFEVVNLMLKAICDDLNIARVFGIIFENLDKLKKDELQKCAVKSFIKDILGLTLSSIEEKKVEITPEIEKLIEDREKARKEKNWKRADEIRDKLVSMGVQIQDLSVKK